MLVVILCVVYGGLSSTAAVSPMSYPLIPGTIRIRREPPSGPYGPPYRTPQALYSGPSRLPPRTHYGQPSARFGPPKMMFGPRYSPPRMVFHRPAASSFAPTRVNYSPASRPSFPPVSRPGYRISPGGLGSPSTPVGFHQQSFSLPHRPQHRPHLHFKVPHGFGKPHLPHTNPPPHFLTSQNSYKPNNGEKPQEIDVSTSFGAQKPTNYYGSPDTLNDLGEKKPASDYHVPDTSSLYSEISSVKQKPSSVIYGSAKPYREQEADSVHSPSKPFLDYKAPDSAKTVANPPATTYGKPTGSSYFPEHSGKNQPITEAPLNTPIKSISYTLPTESYTSFNIRSPKKPANSAYKTPFSVQPKPGKGYKPQSDFSSDGIITHQSLFDSHSSATDFHRSPFNIYDKPSSSFKHVGDSINDGSSSYNSQFDSYGSPLNFHKPKETASPDFYNVASTSSFSEHRPSFVGETSQSSYKFNSYQPTVNHHYSSSPLHHKSPYSAFPAKTTHYSHIPQPWKNTSLKEILEPYYNGPWNSNYFPATGSYDTISLSLQNNRTKAPQNLHVYDTLSASLKEAESQKDTQGKGNPPYKHTSSHATSGHQGAPHDDVHSVPSIATPIQNSFQAPTLTYSFQPPQHVDNQKEIKFPSPSDVTQEFSNSNIHTSHKNNADDDNASTSVHSHTQTYYGTQKNYGEKLRAKTPNKHAPEGSTAPVARNKEPADTSRSLGGSNNHSILPTPITETKGNTR